MSGALPQGFHDIVARLEARNPTMRPTQIKALAKAEMAKRVEEIRTQWSSRESMYASERALLRAEAKKYGVRLRIRGEA